MKTVLEARRVGHRLGKVYPNIWDTAERITQNVLSETAKEISPAGMPHLRSYNVTRVAVWALFIVGLVCLFTYQFELWLLVSVVWLVLLGIYFLVLYRKDFEFLESQVRALRSEVAQGAVGVVMDRRAEARNHTAGGRVSRVAAPVAHPLGVSPRGAEGLVAQWMQYLGEDDASVTRYGGDGGVDVTSLHYVAQVKHHSAAIGVVPIRELAGVAAVDGRRPLFFSSNGYGSGAVTFADRAGVALFHFGAEAGTLTGCNQLGRDFMLSGL